MPRRRRRSRRDGQADPDRDRARGRGAGQSRPRDRARNRPPLLREREPRGHRPRALVARPRSSAPPADMTARGRAVVRVLAVVCLIGAVVLILGVRPSDAAKPPPPSAAETSPTPVWSARRVPSLFNVPLAGATLTRDLSAIVAPYAACVDVDDASGAVTRINGSTPLAPASNQKLLTAVAILETMKADEHLTTRALLDANGNLVIVGGGDPLLATQPAPNQLATPLDVLACAISRVGRSFRRDDRRRRHARRRNPPPPRLEAELRTRRRSRAARSTDRRSWLRVVAAPDPRARSRDPHRQRLAHDVASARRSRDGRSTARHRAGRRARRSRTSIRHPSARWSRRCCATATTTPPRC